MDMNYEISFNDIYYTSALIEYIGRKTLNRRSVIAAAIGLEGIERLLKLACVNHCLSFQQVADEVIERYHIYKGNYDTVSNCKYNVPSFLPIGKVYARLAQDVHENGTSYAATLYKIFLSGIDEKISNFNAAFYFAPRGEIAYYYKADYMHHDAQN